MAYMDTHAGAGRYDLSSIEAQKTGEFREGVRRLFTVEDLPVLIQTYLDLVRLQSSSGSLDEVFYPGSPLIAASVLRDSDRLYLCEIQELEFAQLRHLFKADPRTAIHQRDGYQALKALLPPKEKRGLVLIDPPFEAQEQEFTAIEKALDTAYKKWPNAVYLVWYPIKTRPPVLAFHRWLSHHGFRKVLITELLLHPDNSALRLNGCGIAIINAPYRIDTAIGECLPVLARYLAQNSICQYRLDWLVDD